MTNLSKFPQTVDASFAGPSTTYVTLVTGATNGTKIIGVFPNSNTSVSTTLVTLAVTRSGVTYVLGAATYITVVASLGGFSYKRAVNILHLIPGLPLDEAGEPYIWLENGDTLQAKTDASTIRGYTLFADF